MRVPFCLAPKTIQFAHYWTAHFSLRARRHSKMCCRPKVPYWKRTTRTCSRMYWMLNRSAIRTKHSIQQKSKASHQSPTKINHRKKMKSIKSWPIAVSQALGTFLLSSPFLRRVTVNLRNAVLFTHWPRTLTAARKGNTRSNTCFLSNFSFPFWFCRLIKCIHSRKLFRLPLQEIKQDETPVCLHDILSPMSIDKSLIENDANVSIITVDDQTTEEPAASAKRFAAKDDLEKFFEVEDYRDDILVSKLYICTKVKSVKVADFQGPPLDPLCDNSAWFLGAKYDNGYLFANDLALFVASVCVTLKVAFVVHFWPTLLCLIRLSHFFNFFLLNWTTFDCIIHIPMLSFDCNWQIAKGLFF